MPMSAKSRFPRGFAQLDSIQFYSRPPDRKRRPRKIPPKSRDESATAGAWTDVGQIVHESCGTGLQQDPGFECDNTFETTRKRAGNSGLLGLGKLWASDTSSSLLHVALG